MGEDRWRRFTPLLVDKQLCIARTWNSGVGGQCGKAPAHGAEFCAQHSKTWQTHGRVDGPIPEKKLAEFEKVKASASKLPKDSQQATATRKRKQTGNEGLGAKASRTELLAASNGDLAKWASTWASDNANLRVLLEQVEHGKVGQEEIVDRIVQHQQEEHGRQRQRRASEAKTVAAERPLGDGSSTAAFTATPSPQADTANAESRAREPSVKKPPPKLRCTCGNPIHTERCKLYNPVFAQTSASLPSRSREPDAPKQTHWAIPPRATPSLPPRPDPASMKINSDWARQQLDKIAAEANAQPRVERRALYKRAMLQFHPDKKLAQDALSVAEGRSEAEVSEVFMEVKRRYDQEEDLGRPSNILRGTIFSR